MVTKRALGFAMHLKWFIAAVALPVAVGASAQVPVVMPSAPARSAPLPPAPNTDAQGNPFYGFGYLCKASAGEGEFALNGSMQINPDGELEQVRAKSAMLAANPQQVLGEAVHSSETSNYQGTLRWQLSFWELRGIDGWAGANLKPSQAQVQFQLTPERALPRRRMAVAFGHREYWGYGPSLVSEGSVEKGRAEFSMSAEQFLAFGGQYWMVSIWPFDGMNTKSRNRFGYGWIPLDRLRQTLANVDPLNRKFQEILSDYRNLCDPEPYFQDRSIVI